MVATLVKAYRYGSDIGDNIGRVVGEHVDSMARSVSTAMMVSEFLCERAYEKMSSAFSSSTAKPVEKAKHLEGKSESTAKEVNKADEIQRKILGGFAYSTLGSFCMFGTIALPFLGLFARDFLEKGASLLTNGIKELSDLHNTETLKPESKPEPELVTTIN